MNRIKDSSRRTDTEAGSAYLVSLLALVVLTLLGLSVTLISPVRDHDPCIVEPFLQWIGRIPVRKGNDTGRVVQRSQNVQSEVPQFAIQIIRERHDVRLYAVKPDI